MVSKIFKLIFSILFIVFLTLATTFYGALAFMSGWNWFVVPATGFPIISYGLAFGLALFISLIRSFAAGKETKATINVDDTTSSIDILLMCGAEALGDVLTISFAFGVMAIVHAII